MKKEKVIKTEIFIRFSARCVGLISKHVKLFHFLSSGDFLVSCEWISQEIKPQCGQDRKTYYSVCFLSFALTHGLIRPNSPRRSNGPITMEMVTRIIMCKLLKSSCSQGFPRVTPPVPCDRYTNAQEDVNVVIEPLFNSYVTPASLVCQFTENN